MTQWTAADLPSFAGRTVIVTGANSGLGAVTARELARVGAQVILAVRNTGKGEAAARDMTGDVEVRRLDLQELASVRQFADGVDTVDVLINNAGVMAAPRGGTADGFETQIGTNHLGHFALTNLLLPKITDRVVAVSSLMHWMGYISLRDLNWTSRPYSAGAPGGGRLVVACAGRAPRLLAHQPARADRSQIRRHGDVLRYPPVRQRRRLRRPANAVCRLAGFTGQQLHRPELRHGRTQPAGRAQSTGQTRRHRQRAVGAVRTAH